MYWYLFLLAKKRDKIINNLFLIDINQKIALNRLIKLLTITNFQVFVKITKIKEKKNLLAWIKKKKKPKKIF